MVDFGWVKEKNNDYTRSQIEFRPYCKRRMAERGIDEELVISTLFCEGCFYCEEQDKPFQGKIEKRHKLMFRISTKYCLIVIVRYDEKVLKVINVIKTSKDLEKKWRKKISL